MILDDSYNANPDSMEAGLETLSHIARVGINVGSNAGSGAGRRSFAALGPMLELGEHAPGAHKHIGAAAAQAGIDTLFVCGDLGKHLEEGARAAGLKNVVWAKDSIALAPLVREALSSSSSRDVVLVKGSRGARMERVVEALLSNEPSHPQRKG